MAAYVELPIDETGTDVIRVEVKDEGLQRAGAGDVVGKAAERFDQAIAQIVRPGRELRPPRPMRSMWSSV